MKKSISYISILLILTLVINSCSTEKNTTLSRFYHNTTGHFNIYFNGLESFKEAERKIKDMPENYEVTLPIYKVENEEVPSLVGAEMDRAVKKSVKMIKLHSITVKPERKTPKKGKGAYTLSQKEIDFYNKTEFNNWVDDSYLLIGVAHYYKHDYYIGMKSMQLILNKFRNEEIRFDAMYWIARSHAAIGDHRDAINYITMLKEDKEYTGKFDTKIELLYADIFIKQKEYKKAIEKLEIVIKETKKKKERARLKYIQAQLNIKIDNKEEALRIFAEVIKMNPPYDMAFSAKINMAKAYSTGSKGSEHLKKTLLKMLKDDKNIEYKDQIYFALAEIETKDDNKAQAEEYYKLSVKKSVSNVNQKALSYLALADINFDRRNYLTASNFYDSTMSFLDKKYADYDKISKKANNLSLLTDNLKIIMIQDSLQTVAKMDSVKRLEYINAIIAKIKADEIAAQNAGNMGNDIFSEGEYNPQGNQNAGKWYFYNPQILAVGKSEFKKKWGARKIEDNWRRKNKALIAGTDEDGNGGIDSSGRVTDNKKVEYYLQDLPLTDSLMKVSEDMVQKAMFNAGNVYDKQMKDYDEAIKSYEGLIKRDPKGSLVLESYFNLYLIHYNKTKDKARAEYYRKKILNEFPYSKYANILTDPNYLKKLEETKDKIDEIYAQAYNSYKNNEYQNVISKAEEAFKISDQNHLTAKFLYLKAMSFGNLGNTAKMKTILEELVLKHPNDKITPQAQDVLDMLNSGKHDPNYYTFNENTKHYYVATIDKNKAVADNIKFKLSSFYLGTYPKIKFTTDNVISTGGFMQIVVKELKNKEEAMGFYNKIISENVLEGISAKYNHFIISEENYNKFMKLPIREKYIKFFNENY